MLFHGCRNYYPVVGAVYGGLVDAPHWIQHRKARPEARMDTAGFCGTNGRHVRRLSGSDLHVKVN